MELAAIIHLNSRGFAMMRGQQDAMHDGIVAVAWIEKGPCKSGALLQFRNHNLVTLKSTTTTTTTK